MLIVKNKWVENAITELTVVYQQMDDQNSIQSFSNKN